RGEQKVDDVRTRRLADVAPAPLERDPELESEDEDDHRDVERVGHVLERIWPPHAPPQHRQREQQDAPVAVPADPLSKGVARCRAASALYRHGRAAQWRKRTEK